MWVFTSFQKGNTKQKRKPPLLPVSPVHDDGNDDEHELFSYLPVPLSAEPVTFTMLTDLPTVQQPVPVINQPIVPAVSATEEESEINSENVYLLKRNKLWIARHRTFAVSLLILLRPRELKKAHLLTHIL